MRKESLASGQIYHIFNKSIMDFNIFNNDSEYSRMVQLIFYYATEKPSMKYSDFIRFGDLKQNPSAQENIVEVIAYCLMPTHFHLILRQQKENGISIFTSTILNSYSRYFNLKHNRKGPLWEGAFKNVLIKTDEHLLHLSRYIHLNPVTAYLVDEPQDWEYSSYRHYVGCTHENHKICNYAEVLHINPATYREFVHNRISYQRDLAKIKYVTFD